MTVTETTLTEITRRLVAAYQPEQVVLFGSHAWGEPDEGSDVDLLVFVSAWAEPAYRRASTGYRSLFGLGVPCDVWVCTHEEVLREAPLPTTLIHKIIREGRVLHSRIRELDRFRSGVHTIKIRHFEDTDTLLIELKGADIAETRDLDENTLLDLDAKGRVLAITVEHATTRAELRSFSFERVAA